MGTKEKGTFLEQAQVAVDTCIICTNEKDKYSREAGESKRDGVAAHKWGRYYYLPERGAAEREGLTALQKIKSSEQKTVTEH